MARYTISRNSNSVSAFNPVLSSRNSRGKPSSPFDELMGRHSSYTQPSGPPLLKLERFVEDFFNKEPELNSRKSSLAKSGNPREGLAVPSRANKRTIFSEFQCETLENNFKFKQHLSPSSGTWLAKLLGLRKQQVVTWFQNKRARERKRAGLKLPRHGKKCIFSTNVEAACNCKNVATNALVFNSNNCCVPLWNSPIDGYLLFWTRTRHNIRG